MLVKPTGSPAGTKLYTFEWCPKSKTLAISIPTSGEPLGKLPGKWGARTPFEKASVAKDVLTKKDQQTIFGDGLLFYPL